MKKWFRAFMNTTNKKIRNNPAEYWRSGTPPPPMWQSSTVMHKKTSVGRTTNAEYDNYTFHPDPEINEAAKQFTKDNVGRAAWIVNGELFAENLYKMRELEKKMGILINEPTEEMLAKSATLRDAYEKYKFVERMALGK
jgi:hypothetical protein